MRRLVAARYQDQIDEPFGGDGVSNTQVEEDDDECTADLPTDLPSPRYN